ncbi:MAG: hypothetical protein ACRD0B_12690, partial [Acidimicrobiales bacterium]
MAACVAALLGSGAAVGARAHSAAGGARSSAAAEVVLSSKASSVWSCPGPLPIGKRAESSSVVIADPSPRGARVEIYVATVAPPGPTHLSSGSRTTPGAALS